MRVGDRGHDRGPRGEQIVDALVLGEDAEEDDDALADEPQPLTQLVGRRARPEELGIDAVREQHHALPRDPPDLDELAREVRGGREQPGGPVEDPPLEAPQRGRERPARRQVPVRDHLADHAALEIRHRGPSDQPPDDRGDRRALVEMAVQDVRPEAPGGPERRPEQEPIQVRPVGREADGQRPHPRQAWRPDRRDLRMVAAHRIGGHEGLDAEAAERPDLLEDPDVAPAVPEERRRGDHQHAHWRLIVAEGRRASGGRAAQRRDAPWRGGRPPAPRATAGAAAVRARPRGHSRAPSAAGRRAGALYSALVVGSSFGPRAAEREDAASELEPRARAGVREVVDAARRVGGDQPRRSPRPGRPCTWAPRSGRRPPGRGPLPGEPQHRLDEISRPCRGSATP